MLWTTRSRVIRVKDGDTLTMTSDLGRGIFHTADIRLLAVFAPELSDPGGPETRDYVSQWCFDYSDPNQWLLLTTYKNRNDVDVKTFDRWIGTIQTMDGSRTLNLDVEAFIQSQGYGGGTGG